MGVELRAPDIVDMERVRQWRNAVPESLRTPHLLTREMQDAFYYDVVAQRGGDSRWWSVYADDCLVGFCGLTSIAHENGTAEVSLILDPDRHRLGLGEAALLALLEEGFGNMGLDTISGECYTCNPSLGFWERMVQRYGGHKVLLPRRKRWQGQLHDAMWFAFWR